MCVAGADEGITGDRGVFMKQSNTQYSHTQTTGLPPAGWEAPGPGLSAVSKSLDRRSPFPSQSCLLFMSLLGTIKMFSSLCQKNHYSSITVQQHNSRVRVSLTNDDSGPRTILSPALSLPNLVHQINESEKRSSRWNFTLRSCSLKAT